MSYRIKFIEQDGSEIVTKKIAPDNPESQFGYEDRKIERKCKRLIKQLKRTFPNMEFEILID